MRCAWRRILPAVLGFALLQHAPAFADTCKPLTRVVSLETTDLSDGRITVLATISGKATPMLVDTASPTSFIDDAFSQALGLGRYKVPAAFYVDGEPVRYSAIVKDMSLGNARVESRQLLVHPFPFSKDGSVEGQLGLDILGNYDVEMDFASHKLNLFLPDHCPGVIYWTASGAGVTPFRVARGGYAVVDVTLDGKPIQAIVDTGTSETSMTDTAAQDLFGLTPTSPDMKKTGDVYEHHFKVLNMGGIAATNVPIVIFHDVGAERIKDTAETGTRLTAARVDQGLALLRLGMRELRRLHLYFAFGEGKLYATAPAPASVTSKPTMN